MKNLADEKDEMAQIHKATTRSIKEERDSYKASNQSLQSELDNLEVY